MKRKLRYFISYAHRNEQSVSELVGLLEEQFGADKCFSYQKWSDADLRVGEQWHDAIQSAIAQADFSLLLISPAFLGSKYIGDSELPTIFASKQKPFFPVMVAPVDFERHDLKGLEDVQIYRYLGEGFKEARAFNKCSSERKEDFAEGLFQQIHDKLKAHYKISRD